MTPRRLSAFVVFVRRRRWTIAIVAGAFVALAAWVRLGPLPAGLLDHTARISTTIVDRHGEVIYEARSAAGTRAEWIQDVPPALAHATLAAEDERFEWHIGLDPIAIVRAAWHDVRAGRLVEGGSTITQQVAKRLLAARSPQTGRGWLTKINEAIVALRLEHRLSKAEILALYVNLAPYGNQIEGAERASLAYFGRSARDLTPAEAAFIAALPQQPTRYNPWKNPAAASARQQRILDRMRLRGWLTPQEYRIATAERVALRRDVPQSIAPHFVERVLAAAGAAPPARIETTLDAGLQRMVRGIIDARRRELVEHHAFNVAVAVLDNRSGEYLAWEGSGNYFDAAHGGAIDGVMTPRQPGSALKPFTYAAAFERGYHPARVLADVPSEFPTAEPGVLYRPRNYDDQFRGPLAVRSALAGSENVPAVAVAADIGVPALLRVLRQAGISTLGDTAAHYGLGITLGNAEVTLADLVAAYAMLARGGERIRPSLLRASATGPGAAPATTDRVVSARTAFWITDILSDDEARAFVFGRGGSLEFPFTVAAKTGTSQAYHDNWAMGYTAEVTVGVWVGNFDRRELVGSSGVTGAGPIFHDVMMAAVERVHGSLPVGDHSPILAPTPDLHRGEVCAVSGMKPGASCLHRTTEWLPDDLTLDTCTWHRATPDGVMTIWPDAYRIWAASNAAPDVAMSSRSHPLIAAPPAYESAAGATFEIVSPLAGATFLRDPTLRAEFQTLPLRARGGTGIIDWRVDGTAVGASPTSGTVRWPLAAGEHRIEATDDQGRTATTTIVVK
ncbi:MAG TPA: penicillin-binding protein 1C [Vicinamibacterales bacterium]|nr:penicillin-binding protein 1C [Vicinamibacterales bacterium]